MKVTVPFSAQQMSVLVAALSERPLAPSSIPDQLALAFDEYCRDHPQLAGTGPDDV